MKINEIFYSLQGEGNWSGLPNVFVRTSGCNLRCAFCDTTYAYHNGKEIDIDEILSKIKKYSCKYVCITGGEPLEQEETLKLITTLLDKNYKICLETNGSKNIESVVDFEDVLISLDIKCPSSNMQEKMVFENLSKLRTHDQVKFVICDKKDYNYAKKVIEKYDPNCTIIFQPVWGSKTEQLAEWILNDKLNVRLSLQLHKLIKDMK